MIQNPKELLTFAWYVMWALILISLGISVVMSVINQKFKTEDERINDAIITLETYIKLFEKREGSEDINKLLKHVINILEK